MEHVAEDAQLRALGSLETVFASFVHEHEAVGAGGLAAAGGAQREAGAVAGLHEEFAVLGLDLEDAPVLLVLDADARTQRTSRYQAWR
jgi:hypothetical protein